MKILKVNLEKPEPGVVEEAVQVMREGGVIVYPADTCYGIGCDPTNTFAMEKLYSIKLRDREKGVSLTVRDIKMIKEFGMASLDEQAEEILRKYFPGPFTFLLVNTNFKYCPQSAVAVRVPDHALMGALSKNFNAPYTTTSANISGEPPAYSVAEMEEKLLNPEFLINVPDLVLDGGELPRNPPSTIVDLTSWPPKVVRQGAATFNL